MALGLEHDDFVHLAVGQPQRSYINRFLHRRVNAADVQRQLAVDEHPDVVVAHELQHLRRRAVVFEPEAHLCGEVEVVVVVRQWGQTRLLHLRGLGLPAAVVHIVGDGGGVVLVGGRDARAICGKERRVAIVVVEGTSGGTDLVIAPAIGAIYML